MARVDSTADTLRNEVDEVRACLLPDIRSKVKTLDATVHAALARLDASQHAPPASTTAATNDTSSTSDDTKPATDNTTSDARQPATDNTEDGAHGAPADRYTATDGTSSGSEATNAAPGHNVRFDAAQDIRHGQATQSSFGDSRFGPNRSFMSPSRSDDSWYRPGNRVPHVTPGSDGQSFNDGSHHDLHRGPRPPRLSTSHGDPTLGGSFQSSNVDSFRKIISPRVNDREKIARDRQLSIFDIPGLAHDLYHGGSDGVKELTIKFLHECGYNSFAPEAPEDVLLCYRDIQLVHRKVMSGWFNSRSGRSGPPLEYIIEKALPNFPKLKSLDARVAVDFYDRLQKISAGCLLPLMPFDAIKLLFKFEGLCPPGLGTSRYGEIGSVLMDILPRLLPATIPEVASAISTVGYESNNGYDLFWRVLELTIPGFDPTIPILPPVWCRDSEVFEFCQAYLLYFRLQSKKNNHFDARTRSCIFLRAISQTDYADIVTLLQAQLDSHRDATDDGHVPHHLRLSGLATMIHNNAKARVKDFAAPRIHKLDGMDSVWDLVDDDELPFCHVQGYEPRVLRLDQGRDRGRGREFDRRETPSLRGDRHDGSGLRGGNRDYDRRDNSGFRERTPGRSRYGDRSNRPSDTVPGRPVRPDQRRRPFLPGVICAACKRTGHEASSCDMLAIAIFVEKHRNSLSDSEKSAIEDKWISRWKDKIGQPTRTPRQVMRAYCEELDISPDHLAQALDWDCWPASDDSSVDFE